MKPEPESFFLSSINLAQGTLTSQVGAKSGVPAYTLALPLYR